MKIHIIDTDLIYYSHKLYHQILILKTVTNDGWIDDVIDAHDAKERTYSSIWRYSYVNNTHVYFYRRLL